MRWIATQAWASAVGASAPKDAQGQGTYVKHKMATAVFSLLKMAFTFYPHSGHARQLQQSAAGFDHLTAASWLLLLHDSWHAYQKSEREQTT